MVEYQRNIDPLLDTVLLKQEYRLAASILHTDLGRGVRCRRRGGRGV